MNRGPDQDVLSMIPGGPELIAWFGFVPSFHDAEILELSLERANARCRLKVHTFQMTPEVDARGYFRTVKHVIVTFQFSGLVDLDLADFNMQNVIDGIALSRLEDGHIHFDLMPSYGLHGELKAESLEIGLEPGIPPNSIYSASAVKAVSS